MAKTYEHDLRSVVAIINKLKDVDMGSEVVLETGTQILLVNVNGYQVGTLDYDHTEQWVFTPTEPSD